MFVHNHTCAYTHTILLTCFKHIYIYTKNYALKIYLQTKNISIKQKGTVPHEERELRVESGDKRKYLIRIG